MATVGARTRYTVRMKSFKRAGAAELKLLNRKREHDVAKVDDLGWPSPYSRGPYLPELHGEVVQARCTKFIGPRPTLRFGNNSKLTAYAWFTIMPHEPGADEELFCAYSFPPNRGRPSPSSKISLDYVIANEGRLGRKERMVWKRFIGSVFKVKLRLVKKGFRDRKLIGEQQYLVVDHIEELVARGSKSR